MTTKFKITDMPYPYCVKTVTDDLTTLERVQFMKVKLRKLESLSLNLISGILIILCSIAGCSDMPYTGSMMPTNDIVVDQYIVSPNEELVCLQNGTDSECLTLVPKESKKADSVNGPIIHIHPERLVYRFYHEGKEIVRAEKIMDTSEIVETLTEKKENPARQTDDPFGDIVVHDADDTPEPVPPPPPPQDPPSDDPPPPPPPQYPPSDDPPPSSVSPPSSSGTQQPSIPPPPPPQDPPSDNTPPPVPTLLQTDDPPSDNTPPPPPPPQDTPKDNTPPPPPQPATLALNSNNQNVGSNDEPETVHHHTPNALYSNSDSGWYVTIYYPENYKATPIETDLGFTITSSNGTIGQKVVRNTSCWLPNTPCNNLIEPGNPRTYSARMLITPSEQNLRVQVRWTNDEDHWEGDPPAQRYLIQARPGGTHRIYIDME